MVRNYRPGHSTTTSLGLADLLLQIYKDMFESYSELRRLKEVANILAEFKNWPMLYDETQLAGNEVPVYAVTYLEDFYVHSDLAIATAAKIKGIKQVMTSAMYHDGLRCKPDEVFRQLFSLKEDLID
jgi:hypothetical protein